MQVFSETLVVPYESLLRKLHGGHDHKGGPLWPNWDEQKAARFNRKGAPVDVPPEHEIAKVRLTGSNWAWAGPVTGHFGHGVSDYATRIAETICTMDDPKLVFSSEKQGLVTSLANAPKWFVQMLLDWFEIAPENIYFVTEPTIFETLNVAAQGEHGESNGPSEQYLDYLDAITRRHFATSQRTGTVYVSRAGVSGKFAGEIAFEAAMRAAGVTIFRPETASVVEQLSVFSKAERLIFAEGSALHGTQLLGRCLGHVTVINRRRGFKLAEAFIRPRSKSLRYLDHVGGLVYGLTAAGKSAAAIGISFMKIGAILDDIEKLGVPIKAHWNQSAYDSEVDADLLGWLRKIGQQSSSRLPESRDWIYRTLRKSGFEAWVSRAEEILQEDRHLEPKSEPISKKENSMTSVETIHSFFETFSSKPSYLEVGVQTGKTFNRIDASRKVAVDPEFKFDYEAIARTQAHCTFHQVPSDVYFGDPDLNESFDFIFLDGLHSFEQTLRDFTNAIERLNDGGIILIDDVMPNSYHSSLRDYSKTAKLRNALGLTDRAWMGDVYKLVYFIQTFFQQFSYATIDAAQPQTVVWREPRQSKDVPERLVNSIGGLPYEDMILTKPAFKLMTLDQILAHIQSIR